MPNEQKPMRPEKTILVCKHKGREVGRIPATAPNAAAYCETLAQHYKEMTIDYVEDPNAGFLAMLHRPR